MKISIKVASVPEPRPFVYIGEHAQQTIHGDQFGVVEGGLKRGSAPDTINVPESMSEMDSMGRTTAGLIRFDHNPPSFLPCNVAWKPFLGVL
jgi:hypothetical protein